MLGVFFQGEFMMRTGLRARRIVAVSAAGFVVGSLGVMPGQADADDAVVSNNGTEATSGADPLHSPEAVTTVSADDVFTTRVYAQPVAAPDGAGEWDSLDTSYHAVPGSQYAVENGFAEFDVRLPEDASENPMRFAVDQYWATVKMQGLDGAPSVAANVATYDDVDGADSVTYTSNSSGVKEDIILDSAPVLPVSYTYRIETGGGVTPVARPSGAIDFVTPDDSAVFQIPAGVMLDSSEEGASSGDVDFG